MSWLEDVHRQRAHLVAAREPLLELAPEFEACTRELGTLRGTCAQYEDELRRLRAMLARRDAERPPRTQLELQLESERNKYYKLLEDNNRLKEAESSYLRDRERLQRELRKAQEASRNDAGLRSRIRSLESDLRETIAAKLAALHQAAAFKAASEQLTSDALSLRSLLEAKESRNNELTEALLSRQLSSAELLQNANDDCERYRADIQRLRARCQELEGAVAHAQTVDRAPTADAAGHSRGVMEVGSLSRGLSESVMETSMRSALSTPMSSSRSARARRSSASAYESETCSAPEASRLCARLAAAEAEAQAAVSAHQASVNELQAALDAAKNDHASTLASQLEGARASAASEHARTEAELQAQIATLLESHGAEVAALKAAYASAQASLAGAQKQLARPQASLPAATGSEAEAHPASASWERPTRPTTCPSFKLRRALYGDVAPSAGGMASSAHVCAGAAAPCCVRLNGQLRFALVCGPVGGLKLVVLRGLTPQPPAAGGGAATPLDASLSSDSASSGPPAAVVDLHVTPPSSSTRGPGPGPPSSASPYTSFLLLSSVYAAAAGRSIGTTTALPAPMPGARATGSSSSSRVCCVDLACSGDGGSAVGAPLSPSSSGGGGGGIDGFACGGTVDGYVCVWDLGQGTFTSARDRWLHGWGGRGRGADTGAGAGRVTSVRFQPGSGGRVLASASGATTGVWDARTHTCCVWNVHHADVTSLAFCDPATTLAVGTSAGLTLLDLRMAPSRTGSGTASAGGSGDSNLAGADRAGACLTSVACGPVRSSDFSAAAGALLVVSGAQESRVSVVPTVPDTMTMRLQPLEPAGLGELPVVACWGDAAAPSRHWVTEEWRGVGAGMQPTLPALPIAVGGSHGQVAVLAPPAAPGLHHHAVAEVAALGDSLCCDAGADAVGAGSPRLPPRGPHLGADAPAVAGLDWCRCADGSEWLAAVNSAGAFALYAVTREP